MSNLNVLLSIQLQWNPYTLSHFPIEQKRFLLVRKVKIIEEILIVTLDADRNKSFAVGLRVGGYQTQISLRNRGVRGCSCPTY